jgi:hypothetical protein
MPRRPRRLSPEVAIRKQIDSASGLVVKHRAHVLAFEVRKRVDPDSEHTRDASVHSSRDRLADSVRAMSMTSTSADHDPSLRADAREEVGELLQATLVELVGLALVGKQLRWSVTWLEEQLWMIPSQLPHELTREADRGPWHESGTHPRRSDPVREEHEMNEAARWLDGNALGGLLQELFGAELTDAPRGCPSCGAVHAVGAHRLYFGAGPVLRCPTCDAVALGVATRPSRHIVHLSGAWRLEIPHIEDEVLG